MADNEAKLDLTADDKVAKAAIDRLTKQVATLEEQLRQLNEKGKRGVEAATEALHKQSAEWEKLSDIGKKVHENQEAWNRGMEKLKEQNRELGKHAEHHSQIQHWLSEQGAELVKIGTGYLAVEKAVDAMVEVHSKWREKLKEIGEEQKKLTQGSVKTLHNAGLLGNVEAEQFIFHGAEGTQEQRRAALEGVTGGAPVAAFGIQKELAEEAVKASPLGIDQKQRGELLGRLYEIDKGKSANDISDLATVMTQRAGMKADQLTDPAFLRTVRHLTSGGMGTEQALGIGMTALQNDEQLKKFSKLGELLEKSAEDFAPKGNPHRLTPEERRAKEFGSLDTAGRIKALQSNEQLASQLGVFGFNKLPAGQIDENTRALLEGEAANAAEGQIAALTQTPLGRARLRGERTERRKAETLSLRGERQELINELMEQIQEGATQKGGTAPYLEGMRRAADFIPGSYSNEGIEYRARAAAESGFISKEDAQEFIKALRENTEATKRNTTGEKRSGVRIDGHNEGQGGQL